MKIRPRFPDMAQDVREFAEFMHVLRMIDLHSFLEIGVFQGGVMARVKDAFGHAVVAGIDPNPQIGEQWHIPTWGPLRMVYGASQGEEERRRALAWNYSEPYDVIFIDGDHTYDNAKSDWQWAQGHATRLVAIHDIKNANNESIDVRRLWAEIVNSGYYFCQEISQHEDEYGIGLVWKRLHG